MTEKQIMHEVKHRFDRTELLELGEELARATEELRELERKKKEIAADLASDQKRADGRVAALAGKIRDKYEFREVACIAVYGAPRPGMKTLRRTDTGEELEPVPMSASEMQQGLDFETPAESTAEPPTQ